LYGKSAAVAGAAIIAASARLARKRFFMSACPRAGCRRFSIALPGGFGCHLLATRNVIRGPTHAQARRMNSAAHAPIGLPLRTVAIPRRIRHDHGRTRDRPRPSGQSERREKVQSEPSSDAIMAGRTRPPGPASSTPGAVVFGYFRDDLERFELLFVSLGHFLFVDHAVEG
jgi:hypothetical protein